MGSWKPARPGSARSLNTWTSGSTRMAVFRHSSHANSICACCRRSIWRAMCGVTPYNFEPVELWFQRWPHLQDVYCYSSDFPHREGQTWSLKKFYENVAPLGDRLVEKFFCTNGELLVA